jgi:hypothetical protein
MSPALVHGKVDRWLLDHEDWIAQGGATRLALCEDWRKVAVEFGAGHPAALGCLLALVREAWSGSAAPHFGIPSDMAKIHVAPHYVGWAACYECGTRLPRVSVCDTESLALVSALEAAPL